MALSIVLNHVQVFSCEILLILLFEISIQLFSSYFCFLFIVVLLIFMLFVLLLVTVVSLSLIFM